MCINELWLTIVGNEDYEVSNCGNVRSKIRTKVNIYGSVRTYKPQNIKASVDRYGYFYVRLRLYGKQSHHLIHRLVATAFIPNPDNKPTVNHKDGIKSNIIVSNLEWATHSENNQHAYNTGLNVRRIGINNPNSKAVVQLDMGGNILNRFSCAQEAERKTNVANQSISKCCLGKRPYAGGYVWKFENK